jgi:hypothetical protein
VRAIKAKLKWGKKVGHTTNERTNEEKNKKKKFHFGGKKEERTPIGSGNRQHPLDHHFNYPTNKKKKKEKTKR